MDASLPEGAMTVQLFIAAISIAVVMLITAGVVQRRDGA